MVIKMNNEFKQGMMEFEQENYEKALNHFECVNPTDKNYRASIAFRISSMLKLERYRDALSLINPLIEKDPYDELLWFDKAVCHINLHENKEAYSAMESLERVVDPKDKRKILLVARLYKMLGNDSKTIEFCDKALEIDENYRDALHEKVLALVNSDDKEAIDDVSARLMKVSDKNIISLMPIFLLKLFSKDFRGCFELVNEYCDDEEMGEMLKAVIYKDLTDELNAELLLTQRIELTLDEALKLMLDFKEHGKDFGKIHGVQYFIS